MHFGGILTATLAAPPNPWLITQIWTRIYRPYLEFMYLNNAYHFYAPEPGPANYMWFRLIYVNKNGDQIGDWYKVPKVDDRTGRHQHSVALEYQRHISLIANVEYTEQVPFMDNNGQVYPFFKLRQECSAFGGQLGIKRPPLIVPFHSVLPVSVQYAKPHPIARNLISSYVRHVAKLHAEHPEYGTLRWIKVYRVRHDIAPVELFAKTDPPLEANDPWTYRAFYMGRYDITGELEDGPHYDSVTGNYNPGDPFLYWLLPVVRVETAEVSGVYASKDYCRLHAGDAKWILPPNSQEWVTEIEARDRFQPLRPEDLAPAQP
jgi:hypothetical protein